MLNNSRVKATSAATPLQSLSSVEAMYDWSHRCQSVTKSLQSSMPMASISGNVPKDWIPEFDGPFGRKLKSASEYHPYEAARLKHMARQQMIRGLGLFLASALVGFNLREKEMQKKGRATGYAALLTAAGAKP
jgi:hypothetical protein